jgi:hypothetical protein
MEAAASALGCSSATAACLCTKPDFGYGVRDCSAQSCPAGTDLTEIQNYLINTYCSGGMAVQVKKCEAE